MLKLSRLYSEQSNIFPDITFRDGINVIYANVTKQNENKSSHSVGKTTLVELMNFMLLKTINNKSILKKSAVSDLVFFLEIKYDSEKFLTIRRPIHGKISLISSSHSSDFRYLEESAWQESNLGLEKAKKIVDSYLSLNHLHEQGFNFRNGLRYCFRKQSQYENTFKVNDSRETDSSWKPYLASVLGIHAEIVRIKYDTNKKVESIKNAIKEIAALPQESAQALEAEIVQIEAAVARMQLELDKFDFRRADVEVNEELVQSVSVSVANFNKTIYEIDQRLLAISTSLDQEFSFDLDKVKELFGEVKIHFPEHLSKSYEALIDLNTQMSTGRSERLKDARKRLLNERDEVKKELDKSLKKQEELASILVQKDAFSKYKLLQSRLTKEESRLAVLNERLKKLDSASLLDEKLQDAKGQQSDAEKNLEAATRTRENPKMTVAVKVFSEMVQDVLGMPAFFYTKTNGEGNLEFHTGLKDQTSVTDGFSYTRTLSAIFDFTLLLIHSKESFYRFCYHDGLFESLDDRVKFKLIKKMREISEAHGLQLIVSVLDSDLPISKGDKKYSFPKSEIIRELHDKGDSGRLFRMPAF